jgi:multiple sugar transport system ATP-binding protein
MASIQLKNVSKTYGATVDVIRSVDLEIAQGEFCVFVGPSGCGKSTLLRMIAGLKDITSGELHIGGQLMNDVASAQRGVAMVFQSYALFPHMTVRENLGFGLSLSKTPKHVVAEKIQAVAKMLQLEALLDRHPKALSGGQRQRVAIGRAIVREPGVFLFDEPLSNLDAALRVQTRFEIAKIHRDFGQASTVYVTHDQVEAMTLADRILLLNAGDAMQREGSVAQCGAPLELYHRPCNLFVAGFIGSPKMNFMPGKLLSSRLGMARIELYSGEQIDAAVDAQAIKNGAPVTVGVRPEDARIGSSRQSIVREVQWQERLGETTFLYLRAAEESDPFVVKVAGNRYATHGQRVAIEIAPEHLHVFDAEGHAMARCVEDSDLLVPQAA